MIEIEEEVTLVYCQHVCNICQKFYTEPKLLPCQHYFCCSCLNAYIQSRVDAFERSCFPCPLCQEISPAPDHEKPQTDWAELYPSVEIESIIENAHHGVYNDCLQCRQRYRPRKSVLEHFMWCDTCRLSLCKECEDQHRSKYGDHFFMPVIDSSKARNKLNYRRACAIHRDEFNDYYCPTCLLSICTKCIDKYHYRCKEIAVICEDYSEIIPPDILSSVSCRRGSSHYSTSYSRLLQDTEIIEPLKSESLYSRSGGSSPSLKRSSIHDTKEMIEPLKSESLYSRSSSPSITPSSSPYKRFSYYDKEEREHYSSQQAPCKPIRNIVTLLTERHEDIVPPLCEDIIVMTTSGIATIIVADVNNNCLKTFSNKRGDADCSVLKLASKPYRLAKLGIDHIAATLPLAAQIVIIKVGSELEVRSTIKTEKRYCGIVALKGHRLLVGTAWATPACLDIINCDGEVLVSVQEDNMGRSLLAASLTYIKQAPSGDILVTDWSKETVICMTPDLTSVLWKYQDVDHRLDHPLGFDCDAFGRIFVADFEGNSVVEMSPHGEFERHLLTGINEPKCVAVDDRGKFYMLLHDGSVKIISF